MNKDKNLENIIKKLYKTKEGREKILLNIIKKDNISITGIVDMKERALNDKLKELNELASGLAFRSTVIFNKNTKDMIKNIKQIKPLVAKDIIKSGVIEGTSFEEKLLKQLGL